MTSEDRHIVIGTTVPPFKAESGEAISWLSCGHTLAKDALTAGFDKVHYFAAIETDARGLTPFGELTRRMNQVAKSHNAIRAHFWTFSIDDGAERIDGLNRLIRICTGRNLIQEFALRNRAVSHILFLDSDIKVPNDSIGKLLEVKKPIVGGDVPAYCLGGPDVYDYPFPVQKHMNTAGFLLVERDVFRKLRWRTDVYDSGSTDDPCYNQDAKDAGFGVTHVRKDVIGKHPPLRHLNHRGHNLEIRR